MKIRIDSRRLSEALTPTLCALTPKSALSVLSSVRLEADKDAGTLTLTGYDAGDGGVTVETAGGARTFEQAAVAQVRVKLF